MSTLVLCIVAIAIMQASSFAQSLPDWRLAFSPPCDTICSSRDLAAFDSNSVYFCAVNSERRDYKWLDYSNPQWYRSLDGGTNWSKIDFGIYDYVDRFAYIRECQHEVYATGRNEVYVFSQDPPSDSISQYEHKTVLTSSDKGTTWSVSPIGQWDSWLIWPLNESGIVLRFDESLRELQRSLDLGKTYSSLGQNQTLIEQFYQLGLPGDTSCVARGSSFAHHSIYNYTFAIRNRGKNVHADTFTYKTAGLNTLVSSDEGSSWTYHNYRLPGDSAARIYVELQPIKKTLHLYGFNSIYREGSDYQPHWIQPDTLKGGYNADGSAGLSFLHSSDQGKTWTPNYDFAKRFRAFEAVAPGEVWMTVCPEETITNATPAWWIVHTTDNGATWEIDSTSLKNPNPEDHTHYDGQIITFTDRTHGWIAAEYKGAAHIFRYDPQEKSVVEAGPSGIERPIFSYYPHPVTSETTLLIPETLTIQSIEFCDVVGRKVFLPYSIGAKGYEAKLITQGLTPGIYLSIVNYTAPRGGKWRYTVPLIVSR